MGSSSPSSPRDQGIIPLAGPYLLRVRPVGLTASDRRATLQPGSLAVNREDAMRLLGELGELRGRLDQVRDGLRALLEDGG